MGKEVVIIIFYVKNFSRYWETILPEPEEAAYLCGRDLLPVQK